MELVSQTEFVIFRMLFRLQNNVLTQYYYPHILAQDNVFTGLCFTDAIIHTFWLFLYFSLLAYVFCVI